MQYFIFLPFIILIISIMVIFIKDNLPKLKSYRKLIGGAWFFVEDKWDSAQYGTPIKYWCKSLTPWHSVIKKEQYK